MISTPRYVVIYKDDSQARNQYYGPFTSERTAAEFCDTLPDPVDGGVKTFKPVQPYTADEAELVASRILNKRISHKPHN
jgi:hypothetical protein